MKTTLLHTIKNFKTFSKTVLVLSFLALFQLQANAQVTIKGKISDGDGIGIPHLNILVSIGTSIAVTKTDAEGDYEYSSSTAPQTGVIILGVWDCNNIVQRDTITYSTANVDLNIAGICAESIGTGTTRCNVGFTKNLVTFPGTEPFTYSFLPIRVENGKHTITAESTWKYGDGNTASGNNSTPTAPSYTYTQLEKDTTYNICFSAEFQTGCIAEYCDTVFIPGTGGSSSIKNHNLKNSINFQHHVSENEIQFNFDLLKSHQFEISIVDIRGVEVHQSKLNASIGFNQKTIDVSNYKKGIYILNLSNDNGMVSIKFAK